MKDNYIKLKHICRRYKSLSTFEYGVENFIGFCIPIFFLYSSIIDKYWINKSNWHRSSFRELFFHPAFI